MPSRFRCYIYAVISAGTLALVSSLAQASSVSNGTVVLIYPALERAAPPFKVKLPGLDGTYSLNAVFIPFGLSYLSPAETILAAGKAVTAQSFRGATQRPRITQVLFNLANVSLSIATAFVKFTVNSLLVCGVLSIKQDKTLREIWAGWYRWNLFSCVIGVASGRPATQLPDGAVVDEELPRKVWAYLNVVFALGSILLTRCLLEFDSLPFSKTVLLAPIMGTVQSLWRPKLPPCAMKTMFSVFCLVFSTAVADTGPQLLCRPMDSVRTRNRCRGNYPNFYH